MKKELSAEVVKPAKPQAEILRFTRYYRRKNGWFPSQVEIAKHFKTSVSTVHQHIYSLRSKNLLLIEKGKKRPIVNSIGLQITACGYSTSRYHIFWRSD